MLKVLHTGDWHIGSFPGPEVGGQNARFQDICRCLDFQAMYAEEHRPDLIVVSGDIFHQARVWSDRGLRESRTAIDHIRRLSNVAPTVVLRGTPNHDSEEQFEMLVTAFYGDDSVSVVTEPEVLHIHTYHGQRVDVACIPGFDRGVHRAAHPGLSREEETQVFTDELAKVVLGLKAQCEPGVTSILSTHFTVPGCNMESGQTALFAQFEPVIYPDTLKAADFDLVALGHIHRPQQLPEAGRAVFYCGSITGLNFNDENQPRGFYIHDIDDDGEAWSEYVETPYREFETIRLNEDDVCTMLSAERVVVPDRLKGKIVRVLYTCSDETNKAFNKAVLEKRLYDGGVFYVSEITPEEIATSVNRDELHGDNSPEQNLAEYLTEKEKSPEDAQRIIELARPIISEAMKKGRLETPTGVFMPVEIEVKNYRNYRDELFSYDGISFATINGENGAGKSSLFMDAMLDALFEEPREGDLTGWICNDPDARSGSIKFTFYLGDKLYRVTRTRTKSGKATLNLSEYVDESWQNRSAEKYRDTQTIIENTIGMDSLTLKATGLIMQDQYGLFLQADKADRMAILGNILGLGIYDRMESMAANRAADANRELRRIADLQEETGRAMPDKATVEATMNKTAIEKASAVADRAIHTKAMSEAQTKLDIAKQAQKRSEKLTSELGSWIAEKNANASAQAVCRAQISDAQALLDKREEVEAGSRSYGKLSARREELLGTAALIQPKEEKLRDVMAALSTQRKKKSSLEAEKLSAQATCWSYEQALADYEELERKAADLAGASERLAALEEQDEQYLAADQEAMKLLQTKNAETARIQSWLGIKESEVVHIRSRAIMLETCGCPVENPECRFLQDAVEAKKKLPTAETELETYRQQAEERAEQLDAEYQAAKKKATNLNCRKDLQAQRFLVADLRKASERFAKLTAQKERLAEVKERIKFNTLCFPVTDATLQTAAITKIKYMRESMGKGVNVVLPDAKSPDHEGVINVTNSVVVDGVELTHAEACAFVAGITASASCIKSNTYEVYNGATGIVDPKDNEAAIAAIKNGEMFFSYSEAGNVIIEYDINSLVSFKKPKDKTYSKNRVIRTLDAIQEAIQNNFPPNKYDNSPTGYAAMKGIGQSILKQYEDMGAIKNVDYDADFKIDESLSSGDEVYFIVAIQPVDSAEKLFFTVKTR